MDQVLFWVPTQWIVSLAEGTMFESWFVGGIPIAAYGIMLFIAFIGCIAFATSRAKQTGVPIKRETMQDLLIALFVCGLLGARLVYMWQFNVPMRNLIKIWEGGIVLYGGIIGGTLGCIAFYWFVLRKKGVKIWQLADLSAPTICLGVAIGRIGCLLNGCCYGNVAGEGCAQIEFPMLTSPARDVLVQGDGSDGKKRGSEKRFGLQTTTGFSLLPVDARIQSVVDRLEPGSAAEAAGLLPGDRIVRFDYGEGFIPNGQMIAISASPENVDALLEKLKSKGLLSRVKKVGTEDPEKEKSVKIYTDDAARFHEASEMIQAELPPTKGNATRPVDALHDMFISWPRGRTDLQFVVLRDGKEVELPRFTPRTLGLHPTQLYETISMLLLMALLLAFYPFRRHNGQVLVLFMAGYAIHRYLNEILRSEPVEGFQMTLSQLISLGVLMGALALEIYLRWSQPKRGAELVKT